MLGAAPGIMGSVTVTNTFITARARARFISDSVRRLRIGYAISIMHEAAVGLTNQSGFCYPKDNCFGHQSSFLRILTSINSNNH